MQPQVRTSGRRPWGVAAALAIALAAGPEVRAQIAGWWTYGPQDQAQFGFRIATVGDIDGDGIDDIVVGDPYYSSSITNTDVGRASILSGATLATIRDHLGQIIDGYVGFGVSGVGDIDGDGVSDYAIYGMTSVGTPPTITVYSGAAGSTLWSVADNNLGYRAVNIGDVDGDGLPELIFGSIDSVLVVDSHGNILQRVSGPAGVGFGLSYAACGDIDGDGVGDFVVGSPFENDVTSSGTLTFAGAVHAFSGAHLTELYVTYGAQAYDEIALSLASIGDVDGDGIRDVLAGSNTDGSQTKGDVQVISAASGAILRTYTGPADYDYFGISLAGLGDMNHDGVDDYIVGASSLNGLGAAFVYSGADGSPLWEFDGVTSGIETDSDFGYSFAGGDFNGDGIADVMISDPRWAHRKNSAFPWLVMGAVFQYLGCPAWSENYGAGWPGELGVPGLVALDDPAPGASLSIQLDDSSSSATNALLLIGLSATSVPTGKGGTILVAPFELIPLPVGPGSLVLTSTIPDDGNLYFFDLYLQALELDPLASKDFSFTPGLRLHFGLDLP